MTFESATIAEAIRPPHGARLVLALDLDRLDLDAVRSVGRLAHRLGAGLDLVSVGDARLGDAEAERVLSLHASAAPSDVAVTCRPLHGLEVAEAILAATGDDATACLRVRRAGSPLVLAGSTTRALLAAADREVVLLPPGELAEVEPDRVLVAVPEGEEAVTVATAGARWAAALGASLLLVHVRSTDATAAGDAAASALLAEVERVVGRWVSRVEAAQRSAAIPADGIAAEAYDRGAGLVVVGGTSLPGLVNRVVPSTAERVAHDVVVPTVVVRRR
jgi:nucleotide-binding universal stress UspA family protein